MAATLYGRNIPTARPTVRKVDMRSLSYGLGGPEQPYPVYQFAGGRNKLEYPKHNPFKGLDPGFRFGESEFGSGSF